MYPLTADRPAALHEFIERFDPEKRESEVCTETDASLACIPLGVVLLRTRSK